MKVDPILIAAASLALATPALSNEAQNSAFERPVLISFDAPADLPSDPQTPTLSTQSAPALSETANWTGFYVGGQLGIGIVDTDLAGEDEDIIGGVTLGYDYDFGRWVLGGGLDYDFADIDAGPNTSLEEIFRLKIRGGPKIGKGLLYATGGWANADTDNAGDDDGWFIGGGYDYMINSQVSVGGEVLYHEFDNFNGTGNDIEATTVQIRATYRF